MKLLTKFDLAEMFSCTPSASVKLMRRWKVPAYYLGPGRGKGYRWEEKDVEAAINKRKVCNTESPKKKRKTSSIFDMSYQDIRKKVKGY